MTVNIFSFLFAFLSVAFLVMVLCPIAQNLGLVDKPSNRKQHVGEIPLVGGLAIFSAITVCSFVLTPFDTHYKIYLLSTSFMVLIGTLDDYYDLEARLRLIAQFLIGSLMVFGAGLYIDNLGAIFGGNDIVLGDLGQLFTVLAAVTCINAFNMTDGVDGLVGSLSLNTFISIGILAVFGNIAFDNSITAMLIGAIVAFLFFNLGVFKQGKYKIFMGDAGSMLMGLTVIWFLTYTSGGAYEIMRPITAVWIIAIPLMDMFSVMLRRIIIGHSPLLASRDHLHHVMLKLGLSDKKTTFTISLISALLCSVGVSSELYKVSEAAMTGTFVLLFIGYNIALINIDKKIKNINSI